MSAEADSSSEILIILIKSGTSVYSIYLIGCNNGKNLLVTIPRIFIFSFNALSSIFIVGTNLSKTLKGIPMILGTFILFNASSISLTLVVFVIYPPNIAIKVILDAK